MTTDTLDINPRNATSRAIAPWLLSLPLCFAACAVTPDDASDDIAPGTKAVKHCAVNLRDRETTCYGSFDEAIAHATGGRITDASRTSDAMLADRINALAEDHTSNVIGDDGTSFVNTTLIGTVYKAGGFSHDEETWDFYVPGTLSGCDGSVLSSEFSVENLNELPYTVSQINDQISSFRAFRGCHMVLWVDWFFGGDATNDGFPVTEMDYVGDFMNDRASSIAWF